MIVGMGIDVAEVPRIRAVIEAAGGEVFAADVYGGGAGVLRAVQE